MEEQNLFMTVCNAALGQVVRRQLNIDTVTHQDADAVAAHAARYGREHHMLSIVDLDLEIRVWLFVHNYTGHFYEFFFHVRILYHYTLYFRRRIVPSVLAYCIPSNSISMVNENNINTGGLNYYGRR